MAYLKIHYICELLKILFVILNRNKRTIMINYEHKITV